MNTAQVIPFQFDTREIRTLLIDDQPWFCAADVCAVLGYANNRKAITDNCRKAGVTASDIRSGGQKRRVIFINEGNLYRLIIKSRKEEAQQFEAWVCDEVLPTIRKHGRYDIANATIGTNGLRILHELIGKKIKLLPTHVQRQARAKLWSMVHTRFNVPRAELIAANDLDAACTFVAACTLEGQYLPKAGGNIGNTEAINLYALCQHMIEAHEIFRRYRIYDACRMLGSPVGKEMHGRLTDGAVIAKRLASGLEHMGGAV